MSFCGGSCSTCCREASCASGISGSWLTGAVRSCSRCASSCWPQLPNRNWSSARQREIFRDHSGPAHGAEARWQWSTDSRPPKRDCALLHSPGKLNDLLFDISHSFTAGHASTQTASTLSTGPAPRGIYVSNTASDILQPLAKTPAVNGPARHSKRITSRVQTAHFKSLYRKRSGPGFSEYSRSSRLPERFRYSPRTFRTGARIGEVSTQVQLLCRPEGRLGSITYRFVSSLSRKPLSVPKSPASRKPHLLFIIEFPRRADKATLSHPWKAPGQSDR